MEKKEYLDLAGYDPKIWDIKSKKVSDVYLKEKGHQNNMYRIVDRKAIEAFGRDSYVIKIQWMNDTIDIMDAEGRSGSDKQAPPPPTQSKVPPPPNKVPPPPIIKEIDSDGSVPGIAVGFLCDKYDNINELCEKQCKFCKEAEANGVTVDEQKKIAQEKLQKIVDDSGVPSDNVIIATVPKVPSEQEAVKELDEIINDIADSKIDETATKIEEGLDHKGSLEDIPEQDLDELEPEIGETKENALAGHIVAGSSTDAILTDEEIVLPINKDGSVNTEGLSEDDARNAIMEAQKDTKKGKLVGTLTGKKATKQETEDSKKLQAEEKAKKKADEKKPKSKPIIVIPGSDEIIQQFKMVDEIQKTCVLFKNTFFAINQVKEILNSDTTHARKITAIKKAVENV